MDFEQEYQQACITPSDMYEHLPIIAELASECTHCTELGVGWGVSTKGFLRNDVELHSYEFNPLPGVKEWFDEARASGRNVTLHVADTRKVEIAPTDMMLVDSLHVYEQVQKELELHADKVSKYILFHDTTLFAVRGEFNGRGIWPAIEEFLEAKKDEWELVERRTNCNGLTIIKRIK
jgi:hypothetical protein